MNASQLPRWARRMAVLLALLLISAFPGALVASSAGAASSLPHQAAARPDQLLDPLGQTDRVLIRWSTALSPKAAGAPGRLAALATGTGRQPAFVRLTGSGAAIYDLGAPLGQNAKAILAALREAEGVTTVEADLWMTTDTVPSDPRAAELWGLLGATDASPYGIDAPGAWATSTGSGVVVAVIDTGLVAHEDLAGQAVAGYDMIWDTSVANDGNGREPNASDPGDWCGSKPSSWHGTHVAGTIAALSSNAIGVFGGAPGVKIQPVRVLGTCGGYMSDVADGIRWAAGASVPGVPANATPADVLNLSLGGSGSCPAYMSAAISDARSRGAVVVVAAGNSAVDASGFTPANCNGVITVAATDQAGHRASFSNYGAAVEVAAPGVLVLSTVDSGATVPTGSAYAKYGGTSMAAPHVALSAALLTAAAPALTPAQIEAVLAATSTPFSADASRTGCPDVGCGAGIVHAARAVASLVTGADSPFTDIAGNPFEADIDWAYAEGITLGCNPPTNNQFCPKASVTREQMASFLVRAFDLPPTTTDYFTDDSDSVHEPDINALREANITLGCNPPTNNLFCPSVAVSREQMASFLIRALKGYWLDLGLRWLPENLPGFVSDRFDDYGAGVHVADINGLAAAGITNGCGERLFCPTQVVPREQMAAFLHRARVSLEALPRTGEAAEMGVQLILGLNHDLGVPQSSSGSFELSAFTYQISLQSRDLDPVTELEYQSVTLYSLQTLTDIDVDFTFPGIPDCSLSIDSTNVAPATAATLVVDLMFVQPIGEPMSSIRLEVTDVPVITWSLDADDYEGCPMEFMGDLSDYITDLLADSIVGSLLTVTELCRGDDTQLFIPCAP